MTTIIVLIIVGIIVLFFWNIMSLVEWQTHKDMTKIHSKSHKYPLVKSNYDSFVVELSKRTWKRQITWPTSFFNACDGYEDYHKNYIHASIIAFNGVCMQLDYFSFRKYSKFIKKYEAHTNTETWTLNN